MILNSWKDIASYLGCSVRTAQRCERLGMPVRRPSGHFRSAVVAMSDEIEVWQRKSHHEVRLDRPLSERGEIIRAQSVALRQRLGECRERSESLRLRAREIRLRSRLPAQH